MRGLGLGLLLVLAACGARHDASPLRNAIRRTAAQDPVLADFYRGRDGAPLWILDAPPPAGGVSPTGRRLLQDLSRLAPYDRDLRAEAARLAGLLAAGGALDAPRLAALETGLSSGLLRLGADQARSRSTYAYVDPTLKPSLPGGAVLLRAAAASPEAVAAALELQNPIAANLLTAYWRTPPGDVARRRLILRNYRRAEGLPRDLGRRHILVDIPAERLDLVEDGVVAGRMKVVVGKPSDQTPSLAAFLRAVVARPYWNIPSDITADRIAPKVLAEGTGVLQRAGYEALAGWDAGAPVVDPESLDWRAAAAGRRALHLRQLPGPGNMMGRVKFMFPNAFGVYLHDTPNRGLFREPARADSHGCVRVEDAPRLARWLLGSGARSVFAPGPPETALELRPPIPVYLVYLTATADANGVLETFPDIYGRDRPEGDGSAGG